MFSTRWSISLFILRLIMFIGSLILIVIGIQIGFGLTTVPDTTIAGIAVFGIGFAGLCLLISENSDHAREQLEENTRLLQLIIRKLDSGIIITQNVNAIIPEEKSKTNERSLFLRGTMAGIWGGAFTGILTGLMFAMLTEGYDHQSMNSVYVIAFIFAIVILVGFTLLAAREIEKLESPDLHRIELRE